MTPIRVDEAWLTAVAALWPDASVEPVRGRSSGVLFKGAARELVFLRDARTPRLLLPAGMPRAAAGALRRYSHDLGVAQRVLRGLTARAVRTGLPERLLTDRLVISGDGESIEDHLSGILGRDVVVSIGLGSERANRKPILNALTASGESAAFVKVGDTAVVRDLVRGEAKALEYLSTCRLRELAVPKILWYGEWRGLDLLVLSTLPAGAPRSRRRTPVAAMRELSQVSGPLRAPLTGSAFWNTVRAAAVSDPGQAERFAEVIERTEAAYGNEELDFGAWHGDWTPWNMSWKGGAVQLWDWERFASRVPYGFDQAHYETQVNGGIQTDISGATLRLYLVELCRRYLLAAQEPGGAPLRSRTAELLESLRQGGPS